MDIQDLEKSFKEEKEYSAAAFKVITQLQEEVSDLKSKNASLEQMVAGSVPLVGVDFNTIGIPNEVLICETQLVLLKNSAMGRELTMEEAKKVQIYTDVLDKARKKPNNNSEVEKLSNEDLINVVQIKPNV